MVALVAAARATLLFCTPLVPGMNGAYYLVQARSVLTHGTLGIPDLPLAFYLQAALAWVANVLTGQPLESCVLAAVKVADSVLPAFLAIPVALLALRWIRTAGVSSWLA